MRKLKLVFLLIAPALAGCDDPFGPVPWNDLPIDVRLWSIDRADLVGLPSAYDFFVLQRVIPEDPNSLMSWDVVLSDVPGGLAFTPSGAFADVGGDVGIVEMPGVTFDELLEAPRDPSVYVTDRPVPLVQGGVYVVRSRRTACGFGSIAPRYAKVSVTTVNVEEGTVVFRVVRNPNCNDRSFVSPEDDD